jgi:hypothetical protein
MAKSRLPSRDGRIVRGLQTPRRSACFQVKLCTFAPAFPSEARLRRFVIFFLGYSLMGSALSTCADSDVERAETWRRTAHGWEHPGHWQTARADQPPARTIAIHPLVVASLQLLISVGALVAGASPTSQPVRHASDDSCSLPLAGLSPSR